MKLGLVVEGLADGAVCEVAAKRLRSGITVHPPTTLVNKPLLLRGCGEAAAALLTVAKCDKVVVVWDLYPNWPDEATKKAAQQKKSTSKKNQRTGPDCKEDRAAALASLESAGLADDPRVSLVCIERELETWLIADAAAITSVLVARHITPDRLEKIKLPGKPERHADPKGWLEDTFYKARKTKYTDRDHAPAIMSAIGNLNDLRKVQSFSRFAAKLLGVPKWPTSK